MMAAPCGTSDVFLLLLPVTPGGNNSIMVPFKAIPSPYQSRIKFNYFRLWYSFGPVLNAYLYNFNTIILSTPMGLSAKKMTVMKT